MIEPNDDLLPKSARRLAPRLIASFLIAVSVVANVVAAALVLGQNQGKGAAPQFGSTMTLIVGVVLAANLAVAGYLPHNVARQGVDRILNLARPAFDPRMQIERLFEVYTTTVALRMALLEAPAMLGAVGYFMGADPWCLALAGTAVFFMILGFPTDGAMRRWMQERLDQVALASRSSTA